MTTDPTNINIVRYEATVQAAEERADRLRAAIARNVECAHYDRCDCGDELRAALAADDAARTSLRAL